MKVFLTLATNIDESIGTKSEQMHTVALCVNVRLSVWNFATVCVAPL